MLQNEQITDYKQQNDLFVWVLRLKLIFSFMLTESKPNFKMSTVTCTVSEFTYQQDKLMKHNSLLKKIKMMNEVFQMKIFTFLDNKSLSNLLNKMV